MGEDVLGSILEAAQIGISCPVGGGEGMVKAKVIGTADVGHLGLVVDADKFPPAKNLPEESFDGIEGGVPLGVGVYGPLAEFLGGQ